jgi:hypothetical protein
MYQSQFLIRSVVLFTALLCLAVRAADPIVFPAPEKIGRRWVDITRDPYNAKNDGSEDITPILNRVFAEEKHDFTRPLNVYLPKGEYLMEGPVQYGNMASQIRGQGPEHTIIRVADKAAQFQDAANPLGLFRTGGCCKNNTAFRNYIRDLTINTGNGNPGIRALEFISSNTGAVLNVHIVSGDGKGHSGLAMNLGWPGPLLIKDLTVDGFDYGIWVKYAEYGQAYENITLRNQNVAGMKVVKNMVSIRNLMSENSVPALDASQATLVAVLDATLNGGAPDQTAIIGNGSVYLRSITAQGYAGAYKRSGGDALDTHRITELVDANTASLFDDPMQALNLPVEETPEFHDQDLGNWVYFKDYSSIAALQDAIDTDQSITTICFGVGAKNINGTLRIPSHIRKLWAGDFLLNKVSPHNNESMTLEVADDGADPLILEGLVCGRVTLKHTGSRPVVGKYGIFPTYEPGANAGNLFLEDILGRFSFVYDQKVWARQLNSESLFENNTLITNDGADLWILGFKSEGGVCNIITRNGGRTELLGNFIYPVHKVPGDLPIFEVTDAAATLFYRSYNNHSVAVQETRGGQTKTLARADFKTGFYSAVNDAGNAVVRNAPSTPKAIAPRTATTRAVLRLGTSTVKRSLSEVERVFTVQGRQVPAAAERPAVRAQPVVERTESNTGAPK